MCQSKGGDRPPTTREVPFERLNALVASIRVSRLSHTRFSGISPLLVQAFSSPRHQRRNSLALAGNSSLTLTGDPHHPKHANQQLDDAAQRGGCTSRKTRVLFCGVCLSQQLSFSLAQLCGLLPSRSEIPVRSVEGTVRTLEMVLKRPASVCPRLGSVISNPLTFLGLQNRTNGLDWSPKSTGRRDRRALGS